MLSDGLEQKKDNDFIISELHAQSIYDRFISPQSDDKDANGTTISIEGTYGSGKSTIKEKFKKKLDINKTILVDYVALQHEEPSQVTSQLYMKIGDKLGCENKHLLSACAVLKKENIEASYISGNVGVVVFILCLITLWFKMVYNQHYEILKIVKDIILFVILPLVILVCLFYRNSLVRIISGLLPRYTHIKILEEDLQKSEFDGKTLILLIDEIDRLDSRSVKLLLDEVLILHEILVKRHIKHKFFLFYNPDILKSLLSKCEIPDVSFYLQKYSNSRFIIGKQDFFHALHYKIFTSKPSESNVSVVTQRASQNVFDRYGLKAEVPSSRILYCISKHLRSFRDFDRFMEHLISKSYIINMAMVGYNVSMISSACLLDLLIIEIFFEFRYNIKVISLINDINSLKEIDLSIQKVYDEFLVHIDYIYGDATIRAKSLNNEANTFDKSKLHYIIGQIEEVYYEDTKIYSSSDEDGAVLFNVDAANKLENIFSRSFDESSRSFIVEYVNSNFGEFSFSIQAYHLHLGNLKNKDFLITTINCKEFFELIKSLEEKLLENLNHSFPNFIYSYQYSRDLYDATINSILYCFIKLIPTSKEDHELVINEMIRVLEINPIYCSPVLFLVLRKILLPKFIYHSTDGKRNITNLYHFVGKNIQFERIHALFLFEYYKVICQERQVPMNFNLSLEQVGSISNTATKFIFGYTPETVITKIYDKFIDDTYISLFFLGVTIYSFTEKQNHEYVPHSGLEDLIKKNLAWMFTGDWFEVKKDNDFYRTAYNMWRRLRGESASDFNEF